MTCSPGITPADGSCPGFRAIPTIASLAANGLAVEISPVVRIEPGTRPTAACFPTTEPTAEYGIGCTEPLIEAVASPRSELEIAWPWWTGRTTATIGTRWPALAYRPAKMAMLAKMRTVDATAMTGRRTLLGFGSRSFEALEPRPCRSALPLGAPVTLELPLLLSSVELMACLLSASHHSASEHLAIGHWWKRFGSAPQGGGLRTRWSAEPVSRWLGCPAPSTTRPR